LTGSHITTMRDIAALYLGIYTYMGVDHRVDRGTSPPLFEVGGVMCFVPPLLGETNLLFSCLILREMDISLRG